MGVGYWPGFLIQSASPGHDPLGVSDRKASGALNVFSKRYRMHARNVPSPRFLARILQRHNCKQDDGPLPMHRSSGVGQPGQGCSRESKGLPDPNDFLKELFMERATIRKAVVYALVSVVVGLVYMGLLYLMDAVAGLHPVMSVTVAYASAMIVYFIINKLFIFGSTQRAGTGKQIVQFVVVISVNYSLTLIIVNVMHGITGEVYSGSIIAGVVTISGSYFVFDRLIFKRAASPVKKSDS